MNFLVSWPCKVLQDGSQIKCYTLPYPKNNSGAERNQPIDVYTIDCGIQLLPIFLDHRVEVATEMEIGYLHDVFPKLCGEQATGFGRRNHFASRIKNSSNS